MLKLRLCSSLSVAALAISCLALVGCGLEDGTRSGIDGAPQSSNRALTCIESPAHGLFGAALCLCDDLHGVGQLHVRAAGDDPASVGIDGAATLVAGAEIDGSLTTYLDLDWVGSLEIGDDLAVGGNLDGVGDLVVGGELAVAGETSLIGQQEIGNEGSFADSGVPCGCDDPLDIAALVQSASSDDEVEKLASLDHVGESEIELKTGTYYLEDINSVGSIRFRVDGAVAMYVDGCIDTVGENLFSLAPDATLDLYVAGDIQSVGELSLEEVGPNASIRLYVGGEGPVSVSSVGSQRVKASIYAPTATLQFVGDLSVEGAIFAHDLDGVGELRVSYTRPGDESGLECAPPDSSETYPPDPV